MLRWVPVTVNWVGQTVVGVCTSLDEESTEDLFRLSFNNDQYIIDTIFAI